MVGAIRHASPRQQSPADGMAQPPKRETEGQPGQGLLRTPPPIVPSPNGLWRGAPGRSTPSRRTAWPWATPRVKPDLEAQVACRCSNLPGEQPLVTLRPTPRSLAYWRLRAIATPHLPADPRHVRHTCHRGYHHGPDHTEGSGAEAESGTAEATTNLERTSHETMSRSAMSAASVRVRAIRSPPMSHQWHAGFERHEERDPLASSSFLPLPEGTHHVLPGHPQIRSE
jgi:hypothetical protein